MKNKLLTAILALFLPLVSAGQQSLSAFLLTAGPNADPGTLVCNIDDVGGIGYVSAGANGLTVQRVGATVGGIATCEQQTGRLMLRAKVPPVVRFKSPIDLLIFYSIGPVTISTSPIPGIIIICNK